MEDRVYVILRWLTAEQRDALWWALLLQQPISRNRLRLGGVTREDIHDMQTIFRQRALDALYWYRKYN